MLEAITTYSPRPETPGRAWAPTAKYHMSVIGEALGMSVSPAQPSADPNTFILRPSLPILTKSPCRALLTPPALIVLSVLSLIFALVLTYLANRRAAAVGRIELKFLLVAFAAHSALQIVTMSSLLPQGSTALSVLSAIHVALYVGLFWLLLGNALVSLQLVEWVGSTLHTSVVYSTG